MIKILSTISTHRNDSLSHTTMNIVTYHYLYNLERNTYYLILLFPALN